MKQSKTGLILTGGGARGAYQAGVLSATAEILKGKGKSCSFEILSGTSAGAINAAYLGSGADQFGEAVEGLEALWRSVTTDQIFKIDPWTLGTIAARWLLQLSTGGLVKSQPRKALLDTTPLRRFLLNHVDFKRLSNNIEEGYLDSLAVLAIDYTLSRSNIFFQKKEGENSSWDRTQRVSRAVEITVDHIMASSAIPILFPPVKIDKDYYGDGSLRDYTPLSPAIHLGADKLFVIGVRKQGIFGEDEISAEPTTGRIVSVLLNSMMLDAIDLDCERLLRINQTLKGLRPDAETALRPVDVCMVRPSEDIAKIAMEEAGHIPRGLRFLMRGLGTVEEISPLISYLLFEPSFTRRLIDLGRRDAWSQRDLLIHFFS